MPTVVEPQAVRHDGAISHVVEAPEIDGPETKITAVEIKGTFVFGKFYHLPIAKSHRHRIVKLGSFILIRHS